MAHFASAGGNLSPRRAARRLFADGATGGRRHLATLTFRARWGAAFPGARTGADAKLRTTQLERL